MSEQSSGCSACDQLGQTPTPEHLAGVARFEARQQAATKVESLEAENARLRERVAALEERTEAAEGRVLALIPDLTFDGRTTQILCTKSFVSVMLIQSLARFSAAPPALLAHLLRQPMVKRQVHLKNQLLKHPNTPSDAKRKA